MSDKTHIEWTDATWNPVTGCTHVSEGCRNCYAATLAGTRLKHHPSRAGLTRQNAAGEHKFNGQVRFNEGWLDQPLRWSKPRMIFVCAHGDLFHENVPDEWIDQVFARMALAPQHIFQVLTKRPDRMRAYLDGACGRVADAVQHLRSDDRAVGPMPHIDPPGRWWPLPNVWLGVSVEDQAAADIRIPDLLATPAAVYFISAEPLLGPVDLTRVGERADAPAGRLALDALAGGFWHRPDGRATWTQHVAGPRIDWVIAGGESGKGARVWDGLADAMRSLRDQCRAAGVAFFAKQMAGPRKAALPPIPDDLMVREFPEAPSVNGRAA